MSYASVLIHNYSIKLANICVGILFVFIPNFFCLMLLPFIEHREEMCFQMHVCQCNHRNGGTGNLYLV